MGSAPARSLSPEIEVLDGLATDAAGLDALWDRFEVFEALHHSLTICNPMTSSELNDVIDAAGGGRGSRILDIACGSGEYLLRSAQRAGIHGVGIDLSPWMISAAHRRAKEAAPALDPDATLGWKLGDASAFGVADVPDIVVCVGAEWVWHDFRGTARALASMLKPGGVAVIGAARLHHEADAAAVAMTHGVIETIDDMVADLSDAGLVPRHRVDPTDQGWDDYLARTRDAARQWQARYPGSRADQWVADQAEWWQARQRDRGVMGWSVWVTQKHGETE